MLYLIYKTTNLLDGKYYVGMHRTEDRNDRYLGSGQRLIRALRKHGRKNFVKEILMECECEEEMLFMEDAFINLDDPLCYNLCGGGIGGNLGGTPWNKNKKMAPEYIEHTITLKKERGYVNGRLGKKDTEATKKQRNAAVSKALKGRIAPNKGIPQTKEQREANSLLRKDSKWYTNDATKERKLFKKGDPVPAGWSRATKHVRWIYNETTFENKKIPSNDNIPSGWVAGRYKSLVYKYKYIRNTETNEIKNLNVEKTVPIGWVDHPEPWKPKRNRKC
jgi:hypothetical protein